MNFPVLYILGTPLDERAVLDPRTAEILSRADIVVGESASVTRRRMGLFAKESKAEVFFLDHAVGLAPDLAEALSKAAEQKQTVALFSDCGMPILFDPGGTVLEYCRKLKFSIRTSEGPSSWGIACATSGYEPPFLLYGFLPRRPEDRKKALGALHPLGAHTVLMEAPYRFKLLLEECRMTFGPKQRAYLAWDLALPGEWHAEGSLDELKQAWSSHGSPKGEYVLILNAAKRPPARR